MSYAEYAIVACFTLHRPSLKGHPQSYCLWRKSLQSLSKVRLLLKNMLKPIIYGFIIVFYNSLVEDEIKLVVTSRIFALYHLYRVWARPRHCANPALQLKLSLKKTVKGTICPLQNLGKKLERKHTRRVLSRYRNCKLKQNVESIFSCTFKVHSKVTFQSHFTEHVRLMLNQAWWTHVAIFTTLFTNMRTQKFKSRLHNYVFRCPQS